MVVPLLSVLVRIVWIEFIFVSYSEKPSVIGAKVKAFVNLRPASMALFVMFINAVVAIIPNALNLLVTPSIPDASAPIPSDVNLFILLLTSLRPLVAPFILRLSFRLFKDFIVVLTPFSNP